MLGAMNARILGVGNQPVVRNKFAPVAKEIGAARHYDKGMIGDILAGTAIAYGIGKFVMIYFT